MLSLQRGEAWGGASSIPGWGTKILQAERCEPKKIGSSYVTSGFPGGSDGKESACNAEDLGLIPGSGRSPGEGNGDPLQYSGLENSLDHIIHGVTKSHTRLSDFH